MFAAREARIDQIIEADDRRLEERKLAEELSGQTAAQSGRNNFAMK